MNKELCFAYSRAKNQCKALKELYCEKEGKCSFFKTREQIEEQNRRNELNKEED